jgi:hypothetical protein
MMRHRHHPFPKRPRGTRVKRKASHAIVDNYVTHKHPKVSVWLARRPRSTFYFTPSSASWLNAVKILRQTPAAAARHLDPSMN